jgi:hypothetical protein
MKTVLTSLLLATSVFANSYIGVSTGNATLKSNATDKEYTLNNYALEYYLTKNDFLFNTSLVYEKIEDSENTIENATQKYFNLNASYLLMKQRGMYGGYFYLAPQLLYKYRQEGEKNHSFLTGASVGMEYGYSYYDFGILQGDKVYDTITYAKVLYYIKNNFMGTLKYESMSPKSDTFDNTNILTIGLVYRFGN